MCFSKKTQVKVKVAKEKLPGIVPEFFPYPGSKK
jgi:hypothetical protein